VLHVICEEWTTGELATWCINGVNFISPVGIATVDPIWELVAPE